MKKYSIFHPLLLSFYSKDLYRDVGRRWTGTGFLYLLLLLALTWVPTMIKIQAEFRQWVREEAPAVLSQIPTITIRNGEVTTDVETPYFIRDTENNKIVAVIDLTGEYTSLSDTEADVLLTKHEVIARQNNRGTRSYDLSRVSHFELNRERVEGWLDTLSDLLAPLAFPFAVLGSFIYRVLQALLYGLIGLLFANSLKAKLDYSATLRLAVVAVTPAIWLATLLELTGGSLPYFWILSFVLAMAYLFYGVKANTEPEVTA